MPKAVLSNPGQLLGRNAELQYFRQGTILLIHVLPHGTNWDHAREQEAYGGMAWHAWHATTVT